jgi:hypothetical protein
MMRLSLLVMLVLSLLAWVGCVVPGCFWGADGPVDPPQQTRPVWRRTVNGWERADLWPGFQAHPRAEPARAPIHPLVMSGLLLAGSLAALAFLGPDARAKRS